MKNVFAMAIPNLPDPVFHRRAAKRVAKFLKALDGLVAITPHYPQGTLLFFETLNAAKVARNRFEAEGNACSAHIMHAEIGDDMKSVMITDVADE